MCGEDFDILPAQRFIDSARGTGTPA
jgi:hypothetical protein